MLKPARLKCNGQYQPIGIAENEVFLSWQITGEGRWVNQNAYILEIADSEDFSIESQIFKQEAENNCQRVVPKIKLKEKTIYYWRVRLKLLIKEDRQVWTDWSEANMFETAFNNKALWKAEWIEADEVFYEEASKLCKKFWKTNEELFGNTSFAKGKPKDYPQGDQGMRRVPYLRKEFYIPSEVQKARIYITARGFYELYINKKKIGSCALAPDFTVYEKCIFYQTFDITAYLKKGKNLLQIPIADGWFAGHAQSIPGSNHLYGERPALILQAEITDEEGKVHIITSDDSFEAYTGPLLYADLFMGEYLDLEQQPVKYGTVIRAYDKSVLMPQKSAYIEEVDCLKALSVNQLDTGEYIIDFGQVIAGRERIHFKGEAGRLVKLERSESLMDTGDIYNVIPIFPFHDQTNYINLGETDNDYVYEPQFSFQGFRFLKISGLKQPIDTKQCEVSVIETAIPDMHTFKCSNELLNQLTKNAYWSQRGNMISIPTDCPQRERGGFTGDAQIFCKTAVWHQDVSGFFGRWLEQCRFEQLERGQIPITVPYTKGYSPGAPNPGWTSAGWGDAIVFVPWDLYESYGDKHVLTDNFEAMERWMGYVTACAEDTMPERYYMDDRRHWQQYLWNTGYHWGDWQMPGCSAAEGVALSKEITASLYYYREVSTMIKVSEALDKLDRMDYYTDLQKNIYKAFHIFYITEDGHLTTELQGLYVMAIAFGIVDGEEKVKFGKRLNQLIIDADYHLGTGFLSTPFLMDVLWNCGYHDTAYRVLYQDTRPSWLYSVKRGATSIWELWDDTQTDLSDLLTSLNHYAFGTICDFIYRKIAGIERAGNGFRKVRIHPEAIKGIDNVDFSFESPFGRLQISWKKSGENMQYNIIIPHGMEAVVVTKDGEKKLGSGQWTL